MDDLLIKFYAQLTNHSVNFYELNQSLLECINSFKVKRRDGKGALELWLMNRTSIKDSLHNIRVFYEDVHIRSLYFDFLESQINEYYRD